MIGIIFFYEGMQMKLQHYTGMYTLHKIIFFKITHKYDLHKINNNTM